MKFKVGDRVKFIGTGLEYTDLYKYHNTVCTIKEVLKKENAWGDFLIELCDGYPLKIYASRLLSLTLKDYIKEANRV